jgi:hypothetical protein
VHTHEPLDEPVPVDALVDVDVLWLDDPVPELADVFSEVELLELVPLELVPELPVDVLSEVAPLELAPELPAEVVPWVPLLLSPPASSAALPDDELSVALDDEDDVSVMVLAEVDELRPAEPWLERLVLPCVIPPAASSPASCDPSAKSPRMTLQPSGAATHASASTKPVFPSAIAPSPSSFAGVATASSIAHRDATGRGCLSMARTRSTVAAGRG